jgi:hypothetical protein
VLAVVLWCALLASGIDPVVAGLAVGLATSAYVPRRDALEQATTLVRLFREQPTPELAAEAAEAAPPGSPRTSTPPIAAVSRVRPRSSSTTTATTARRTCRR